MDNVGPRPDIAENSISLNEALKTFTKRWKFLLILALLFSFGALVKHKFFPTYPARGVLLIKDVKNSRYQLLLNSIANRLGDFAAEETQGEDTVSLAINFLETYRFHKHLAAELFMIYEKSEEQRKALEPVFGGLLKIENKELRELRAAQILRSFLSYQNDGGGRLKITLKTNNKNLSYIIVSLALKEAKKELTTREIIELDEAQKYFSTEIASVQKHLDNIEKQTISKNTKSSLLILKREKPHAISMSSNKRSQIQLLP